MPAAPRVRGIHRPPARGLPPAGEQLSPEHHQRCQFPDAIERGVRGARCRVLLLVTRAPGRRARALVASATADTLRHLHAHAPVNNVTIIVQYYSLPSWLSPICKLIESIDVGGRARHTRPLAIITKVCLDLSRTISLKQVFDISFFIITAFYG